MLLSGRSSGEVRKLVALPARLGGLGIRDCAMESSREYECSVLLCSPIMDELVMKI